MPTHGAPGDNFGVAVYSTYIVYSKYCYKEQSATFGRVLLLSGLFDAT
jgi:hypothetical protein